MRLRRNARRAAISAAVATVAALSAPGAAPASDVEVQAFSGDLFFFAAAGETNDVTVSKPGANFVVTDPGSAITPGTGCVAVTPNQVTCSPTDVTHIDVRLGNMDDRGTIAADVPDVSPDFFDADVQIVGEAGDDVLNGGPNVSNQLFGGFQFSFTPEPGADVLNGGSEFDNLVGDAGDDVMTGGASFDRFDGGEGNDTMTGGSGEDSFESDDGPDGADAIRGGDDFDDVSYRRDNGVRISLDNLADDGEGCPGGGCEGDDVGADVERVSTGIGDDLLIGSGAPNQFFTDDGDDTINGRGGTDRIFASRGQDLLFGGSGDDSLFGSEDEDVMRAGPGDDVLFSGFLDDDSDQAFGGSGLDVADYSEANAPVKVSLDNAVGDGVAGENDNVHRDVEDVIGSDFGDLLVGSRAANELDGRDGRDRLRGFGGADGLDGGRAADLLVAGAGADALDGGAGPDRLLARGGGADDLSCGSSVDRGTADRRDRVAGDCDRVRRR